jgi:hypothetical protein
LWTRWGRLGQRGQNQKTPFNLDEAAALKEFKKILKQKAGLSWEVLCGDPRAKPPAKKYRVVQLGALNADKRIASQYQSLTSVINVNHITRAFEEDLKAESSASKQLLKDSVLSVVKKYFSMITDVSRGYRET